MDWQREIEGLRQNLASIPSAPGDGAQKLKESYLQKLNTLETQVPPLLVYQLYSVICIQYGFS